MIFGMQNMNTKKLKNITKGSIKYLNFRNNF